MKIQIKTSNSHFKFYSHIAPDNTVGVAKLELIHFRKMILKPNWQNILADRLNFTEIKGKELFLKQ